VIFVIIHFGSIGFDSDPFAKSGAAAKIRADYPIFQSDRTDPHS
jgi:hypothetical protein